MKTPWLPEPIRIPQGFSTDRLRLRPLTIHDVVKDYDAVMSSRPELRELFGPGSGWPADSLTLEQDLIDLAWHQKEFDLRTSFTYTVVSLDGSQVLGCVYLMPPARPGIDAEVFHWVRSSELASGLDAHLAQRLQQWLADEWPFARVAFPGRADPHAGGPS
jgi:hypothetical protein